MPQPPSQTAILAQVGLSVYLDGQGVVSVTGNATLDSSGHVVITFTGLPSQVTLGTGATAVTEQAQVQSLSLVVNSTVNGTPFTFNPSQCVPATSQFAATDTASANASGISSFTPTGCPDPATPEQKTGVSTAPFGGTFSVVPSTQNVSDHPDLYTNATFSYPDGTDTIRDLTLSLPPGVLANPTVVTAQCTPAQLSATNQFTLGNSSNPADGCPAASQIGYGTATANARGAGNPPVDGQQLTGPITGPAMLDTYAYLMRPTDCQSAADAAANAPVPLACVGVLAALGPLPVQTLMGVATLDASGRATVSLGGVPRVVSVAGQTEAAQITGVALAVNGSVDGSSFTLNPSGCSTVQSQITANTYAGRSLSLTSSFTPQSLTGPIGCSPFTPETNANPVHRCPKPADPTSPYCQTGKAYQLQFFKVTPSTTQAGAHPDLVTDAQFAYPTTSDSIRNMTITLPPNLLADTGAVPAKCLPAQLSANACPAASKIGDGTMYASLANGAASAKISVSLYLLPGQAAGELGRIGLVAYLDAGPVDIVSAPITSTTAKSSQSLVLTFSNLPQTGQVGGVSEQLQITSFSLKLYGSVGGHAFLTGPQACGLATTHILSSSWENPTPMLSGASSYSPTTCAASSNHGCTGATCSSSSVIVKVAKTGKIRGNALLVVVRCTVRTRCRGGSLVINDGKGKHVTRIAVARFRSLRYGLTTLRAPLTAAGKRKLASHHSKLTAYAVVTTGGHAEPASKISIKR